MQWRTLARALVDAYHRVLADPVDFWPAYEDEVRKAVTAEEPQAAAPGEDEASAAAVRQRRDRAIDAPSDQTTSVRCPKPGLQRGVTYLGPLTPPADPAPAATSAAATSR